jgi:hypothetical protein
VNLPPLNVGDKLILRNTQSRYATDREVTVTRLGRKWGYAGEGWEEVKFDLGTGSVFSGRYSSTRRVLTSEMDADEKRRDAAIEALKGHDLSFRFGGGRTVSTEALERIVAILAEDEVTS